jgi:hypothetical protein
MKSRWAVEVEGHGATIIGLETYLAQSLLRASDTFIGRLRDVPVLRSRLWDPVNDATVVGQLAQTELALLQGLTKLAAGASPLRVGTIFELAADDAILQQTRESVNDVYVLANSGDPSELFRERMDVVRQHDALAGAVVELSGRPDWIKIYKAVEYLEEHFGGENKLLAAFPSKRAALKRIKRTSQSVRHRARAFSNINNPSKLQDAETFLQSLIKDVIASVGSPPTKPVPPAYVIPKREYPAEQVIGLNPLILVNGEESEVAFVGDTLTVS